MSVDAGGYSVPPHTLWITGLSASGKTTLGRNIAADLRARGITNVVVLDGEELRASLPRAYGFAPAERMEVVREIAKRARALNEQGQVVIVSTISHKREMRQYARELLKNFMEIFLDCPPTVCQRRDQKGHYARAFAGEYDCFVGVTEPYERSEPELVINTAQVTADEAVGIASSAVLRRLCPSVPAHAIIVAAGLGSRLGAMTANLPKCLVAVAGRSLLERQVDCYRTAGIRHVHVVTGYQRECIQLPNIECVVNEAYRSTNTTVSLLCARAHMGEGFIASYADIVFSRGVLDSLLADNADISIAVDPNWRAAYIGREAHPPAEAEKVVTNAAGEVVAIGKKLAVESGNVVEFLGLMKCSAAGARTLMQAFDEASAKGGLVGGAPSIEKALLSDFLQFLVKCGARIRALPIHGTWAEVDTPEDLVRAEQLCRQSTDFV